MPVPARGRARLPSDDRDADATTTTTNEPRQRAIEAMVEWCHDGNRPLWLIEGPSGAGKTLLANEVAYRLTAQRWPCGWARPGLAAYAATAAARNGRRALVLVDDAETRADLFELLRALANGGVPLQVRVIIVAREFGSWWQTMLSRLTPKEQEAVSSARTIMGSAGVTVPAAGAGRAVGGASVVRCPSATVAPASADPASGAVLPRAALVVALSTGRSTRAGRRSLGLRDLFERRKATGGAPPVSLRRRTAASLGGHSHLGP